MLDRLTAAVFRGLSAARGKRVFHPDGVAYRARWEPVGTAGGVLTTPASEAREVDAVVRFSRAIGLPESAPDILGAAVKLLDAHGAGRDQDLALASSGRSAVSRHLLVPTRGFTGAVFSSIAPYAAAGERVTVMAEMSDDGTPRPFEDLRAGAVPPADLHLWVEPSGRSLGTLRVGARLSDDVSRDLRFDPWHTGPGLRPIGWINRLRRPTYAASQEGRDAPAAGARPALDDASTPESTR
ncbi:MAG: hypothetical protein KY457_02980 [Actinobacteria bacterium]|nr:hypothetical protein [Actinomycetota bacterium]